MAIQNNRKLWKKGARDHGENILGAEGTTERSLTKTYNPISRPSVFLTT